MKFLSKALAAIALVSVACLGLQGVASADVDPVTCMTGSGGGPGSWAYSGAFTKAGGDTAFAKVPPGLALVVTGANPGATFVLSMNVQTAGGSFFFGNGGGSLVVLDSSHLTLIFGGMPELNNGALSIPPSTSTSEFSCDAKHLKLSLPPTVGTGSITYDRVGPAPAGVAKGDNGVLPSTGNSWLDFSLSQGKQLLQGEYPGLFPSDETITNITKVAVYATGQSTDSPLVALDAAAHIRLSPEVKDLLHKLGAHSGDVVVSPQAQVDPSVKHEADCQGVSIWRRLGRHRYRSVNDNTNPSGCQ